MCSHLQTLIQEKIFVLTKILLTAKYHHYII